MPSPFENLCGNNNDSSLGRIDSYFLFLSFGGDCGWMCLLMFAHQPAYLAPPPLPRAKLLPIWYLCDGICST